MSSHTSEKDWPEFILFLHTMLNSRLHVSSHSSYASLSISNIFSPYLLNIAEDGGFENALQSDMSLRKGMYLYHGILTNKSISDWFGLPFIDINLLIL